MEKLNLQRDKEDFYVLEVNDNGDTIEFDLTDITLPEKIYVASENIEKLDEQYREQIIKLNETYKDNESELIKNIIKLEKEKSKVMRQLFDSFLGEGACQKIFGDKNNYGQFLYLMEALEPHFNKMVVKQDKAKRKLASKYLPKEKDVM